MKLTLNSKENRKQTRNTQKIFLKIISRKCKLTWIRNEQNNDHARKMHKIQFSSFFNTSIKTVAYLVHHLTCHHWSKFQTKLTTFWGVLAKKQPKTSLNDSFCWYKNIWKFKTRELEIRYRRNLPGICTILTHFIYWKLRVSIEGQQKVQPRNHQIMAEIYQISWR